MNNLIQTVTELSQIVPLQLMFIVLVTPIAAIAWVIKSTFPSKTNFEVDNTFFDQKVAEITSISTSQNNEAMIQELTTKKASI